MNWQALITTLELATTTSIVLIVISLPLSYWLASSRWRWKFLIEAVVAMESAATFDELTRRGEPKGVHGWPRYWAYGHLLSAVDYLKFSRLRAILMERLEKLMQAIDIYFGDELALYTNLAGHPVLAFPRKFEKEHGFLVPRHQLMAGRAYDESTLLALADAYQRAIGLKERPPLEKFLADKEQFLKDEKLPDENKLYTD